MPVGGTELPVAADMVVPRLWRARVARAPDAPFVRIGDAALTSAEADRRAAALASALAAAGIQAGAFVGHFMSTRLESVDLYLACVRLGAAFVPVNSHYRGYLLEHVLNDAGCRILFTEAGFLDRLAEAEPKLASLETVVVCGAMPAVPPSFARLRIVALDVFVAHGAAFAEADPGPRDPHCVIYTSGTTGPSKGVVISHAFAVVKALDTARICRIVPGDVMYSPMPLFHEMGLLRGILAAIVNQASILLRDHFSGTDYWSDIARVRATVGLGFPAIQAWLKAAPPSPRDRDHTLRCLFAVPDRAFSERFGVKVVTGYGMTETANAIYARYDEDLPEGSCGRVADEWEVRLVDDAGEDVPDGVNGEAWLRPRRPNHIFSTYLNRPEATLSAFADLWFHTGDLLRRDAAGFHYFRGRRKDVIRRRGENISGWEVEQVVREYSGVADVVALAHPSAYGDEDVWIVVQPAEGAALAAEGLLAHCRRRMPDFMVPRYVEFRAALPRTSTGRVEKHKLLEGGPGPGHVDAGGTRPGRR